MIGQFRSFERPVQLLLVNQLTINIGFYMLMPYLADHLSVTLGLATWLVGLVLGVRNLSQQGMFLLGGSLADRWGYKPVIVAGCALRTGGFALLALVDSLPALLIASAATGFAGALFNPAVRAYLAHDAGARRVEAFALFNVFYQAGILAGPLIGLALTGVSFRLTCLVAAALFAVLTVLQIRALPPRNAPRPDQPRHVLAGWRDVLANRSFLLFSTAMVGTSVLSFQTYLALPLEINRLAATSEAATIGVAAMFALSGLVAITCQVRVTRWCTARWGAGRSLPAGLVMLGAAFVLPATVAAQPKATTMAGTVLALTPVLIAAVLLTLGTLVIYPFEMDTIVTLARGHLVATHYGLYNTIAGLGIALGNLATGGLLDLSGAIGHPRLPWLALALIGLACAAAVHTLSRRGHLVPVAAEATAGAR
ncbi:MFS transporter [Lentzea sp. BCCO 10_0798]|uniref:MFS transporter n=1 Tax=Lentzea kristufekii TaxID=3095430 RepID=A0ABU4TJL4_9PSEU|nr:MFS transporter [Lentzea sp. BCCO 10_0798]MDX8048472.1 MFS transporter [Lentzea sp. BCCO 10_0798]